MTRRLLESEHQYVENVKKKLLDFYKLLPQNSTDIFPYSIQQCVEKFWIHLSVRDGIQSTSYEWVDRNPNESDTTVLQIIEKEVIPLLKIAYNNIEEYQYYLKKFRELESYVKSWFESPSQTSDAIIHEPRRELGQESREVVLQRKVEELERMIKTWEGRYSSMENDRNTINLGYRMVVDQKNKLEIQKEKLVHKQEDNNAEILTLRGEIGRLKGEVARLEGEVERLTIQNKHKSSSRWSFWKNRSNMQTLLEDLNSFRE
jgi:hypothetical protein